MSIKNKDLHETATDSVRSQISAAIEDGVTGFGDKPDSSTILEKDYTLKVNSLDKYVVAGGEGKGSTVNRSVINKIASIQIEREEIPKVIDKLEAAFVEDALDAAIVLKIIEKIKEGNSPTASAGLGQIFSKFDANRQNMIQQLSENADSVIDTAAAIYHMIQVYESTLAKGNLIRNVKGLVDDMPTLIDLGAAFRAPSSIAPYVMNQEQGVSITSAGDTKSLTGDIFFKISRCLDGENEEVIKSKTVTTLMLQMFALAEDALDYGISDRFFRRNFPGYVPSTEYDTNIDTNDLSTYITKTGPGQYYHEISRCIPLARTQVFEFGADFAPKRLCEIFGFSKAHSTTIASPSSITTGPRSLPQYIFDAGRNPLACVPDFVNVLSVKNTLVYLSSLISRECIISRGISETHKFGREEELNSSLQGGASLTDQLYGNQSVPLSRAKFSNLNTSQSQSKEYVPFGRRLFGPSATLATTKTSSYQPVPPNTSRSKFHQLIQRNSPYGNPNRGFMPLEVLDPSDFENVPYVGPTATTDTLKSVVTNAIYNDPQNVETPINTHLEYLTAARTVLDESNLMLGYTHNVRGNHLMHDSTSITMKIAMAVIQDLGRIASAAAELNTKGFDGYDNSLGDAKKLARGREALCSLVALTTLFKPNGQANKSHLNLKSEFIARACMLDIGKHAQLDPNSVETLFETISGADVDLGTGFSLKHIKFYHPSDHFMLEDDLGYAEDFRHQFNEMRHTLRFDKFSTAGAAQGIEKFDTNYFRYLDHVHPEKYFYGDMSSSTVSDQFMKMHEEHVIRLTENIKQSGVEKNKYVKEQISLLPQTSEIGEAELKNDQYLATFTSNTLYGGANFSDEFSLEKFGAEGQFFGYDFINYVFGPKVEGALDTHTLNYNFETGGSLLARVVATADYIQGFLKINASEERPAASHGVTVTNGMDKSQLIAFVLEMYVILANDLFQSSFTLSPFSTMIAEQKIHDHSQNLSFTAFYSHTVPTALNNSNYFRHLVTVVPKITGINPSPNTQSDSQSIMAGVEQPVVEFRDYANYLQELGNQNTWRGQDHKFLRPEFFEAAFDLITQAISKHSTNITFLTDFKAQMSAKAGLDFKLGETLSFRDLMEAYRECEEEASFPSIACSGATDIFAYMSAMYFNNAPAVSEESVEPLPQKIHSVLTSHNLDSDTFKNFIKKGSMSQVAYARYKLNSVLRSIGAPYQSVNGQNQPNNVYESGLPVEERQESLITAAKMYLDFILNEEKDFVEFTFFGVTNKLHRDEIIKNIAKNVDTTSNDAKSIVYNFAFLKNSELSTDVQFAPNKPAREGFTRDLSVFTTLRMIASAARGQPGLATAASSFFDLVNKTTFYRIKHREFDFTIKSFEQKKGAALIAEAEAEGKGEEVTNILINTVSSIIMSYIFERLTGFPIRAENITSNKERTISKSVMKNFLEAATALDTPVSAPSGVEAVMKALFVPSESSSIVDPVRLTTDENAIKKALEPRLIKDPNNPLAMKFLDPTVSEEMFMTIQALLKTNYVSGASIDEGVLATTTFDAIFGIDTSALSQAASYETAPSEGDLEGKSPSLLDLIQQMKGGDIQLNNYKAVVSRKVQKSETVGS